MKKFKEKFFKIVSLVLFTCVISSCSDRISRDVYTIKDMPSLYKDFQESDGSSQFIKFHLKNGQVIAGREWSISDSTKSIAISGYRYSINRNPIDTGRFELKYDEIALAEKNYVGVSVPLITYTALSIWTIAWIFIGLNNPLAPFGAGG